MSLIADDEVNLRAKQFFRSYELLELKRKLTNSEVFQIYYCIQLHKIENLLL